MHTNAPLRRAAFAMQRCGLKRAPRCGEAALRSFFGEFGNVVVHQYSGRPKTLIECVIGSQLREDAAHPCLVDATAGDSVGRAPHFEIRFQEQIDFARRQFQAIRMEAAERFDPIERKAESQVLVTE
jgi:hypothetical protein